MPMTKFVKRPVIIMAQRYEPDRSNQGELLQHTMVQMLPSEPGVLSIHTLEGDMALRPGDWLVKGVENELYPVKNEIFLKTYEVFKV